MKLVGPAIAIAAFAIVLTVINIIKFRENADWQHTVEQPVYVVPPICDKCHPHEHHNPVRKRYIVTYSCRVTNKSFYEQRDAMAFRAELQSLGFDVRMQEMPNLWPDDPNDMLRKNGRTSVFVVQYQAFNQRKLFNSLEDAVRTQTRLRQLGCDSQLKEYVENQ